MSKEIEDNVAKFLSENGITLEYKFVPFSKSRNKDEGHPSLNYLVTIKKNGRKVLETEYSMGYGHCPADKKGRGNLSKAEHLAVISRECETGRPCSMHPGLTFEPRPIPGGAAILPTDAGVLYSVTSSYDVFEHASFESWAEDYGYDPDSRSAESVYQACLKEALAISAGLGGAIIDQLRELLQGY